MLLVALQDLPLDLVHGLSVLLNHLHVIEVPQQPAVACALRGRVQQLDVVGDHVKNIDQQLRKPFLMRS